MSVINRIEEVMRHFRMSKTGFAARCNIGGSNFIKMMNGEAAITDLTLHRIEEAFGVSFDWLLNGDGEMLPDPKAETSPTAELVPLIPDGAFAGNVVGYAQQGYNLDACERVVCPLPGCDVAFNVTGDSMEPEFPNGSRVFASKINDKLFIAWGVPYVVVTYNGVFIKRLYPKDGDRSKLVAKSFNTDYPPFEIPVESIISIYRIIVQSKSYSAQ